MCSASDPGGAELSVWLVGESSSFYVDFLVDFFFIRPYVFCLNRSHLAQVGATTSAFLMDHKLQLFPSKTDDKTQRYTLPIGVWIEPGVTTGCANGTI